MSPIWYHGYVGNGEPVQQAYDPNEDSRRMLPRKATRNISNPRCYCVETGVKYRTVRECAEAHCTTEWLIRRALDTGEELDGYHYKWCPGRELPPRKLKEKKPKGRRCMRMDTGEVFPTIKALAESLGAPKGTVSHALIVRDKCRGVEIRYCEVAE